MRSPGSAVRASTARSVAAALLLVLPLSACSSADRATSPEEVRELANGAPARKARQEAEDHLRGVVRAYDEKTPLTLGLVAVDDRCAGGSAKEWFFRTGDDRYRIRCILHVSAWFGADPDRIGDVLDAVFTAGDRASSAGAPAASVPFGHDDYRDRLVAYYRDRGPNPTGPDTPEPVEVSNPSQTLSWDTVRSPARTPVEEPEACGESNPPVTRCLREPASTTVTAVRARHGMVFRLDLSYTQYYD
ncbi:hypothetical protein, partial [Streptomyces sp. NPDC058193]|uniref:hypothetical protein n=1 Tax=Streptomyces sp. NPDC058193 TaxID=3346373 RepID=UPI0036EAD618